MANDKTYRRRGPCRRRPRANALIARARHSVRFCAGSGCKSRTGPRTTVVEGGGSLGEATAVAPMAGPIRAQTRTLRPSANGAEERLDGRSAWRKCHGTRRTLQSSRRSSGRPIRQRRRSRPSAFARLDRPPDRFVTIALAPAPAQSPRALRRQLSRASWRQPGHSFAANAIVSSPVRADDYLVAIAIAG